jgi:hypothetical protein
MSCGDALGVSGGERDEHLAAGDTEQYYAALIQVTTG